MWRNSWYMIKLAWTSREKKVLVLCLLSAVLAVVSDLVNLYVSPMILQAVERHVSLRELVVTIAGFALALMLVLAASAYVNENTVYGRVTLRFELINLVSRKATTTSYPNVDDNSFTKLLTKAMEGMHDDNSAVQGIWSTWTRLITSILGFIIYISLLASVQPLLMLVTMTAAVISYFFGNFVNEYGYRHREEEAEYERHMNYISGRAEDVGAAKDIRLFGLSPWLKDVHEKAVAAYTAFHGKAQGMYFWSRIVDLCLAFLRNGIAYAYLISLVLSGGLDVAQFLLLFDVTGGFTEWVSNIFSGFNMLYKQTLDISNVRELLEYHEPFKFDDGEHLSIEPDRPYEIRLENVSFRYPGADHDTLTNVNLTWHPGERLAVVGLNGVGKTTLVKLICGFLDPTKGRVLLDGRDIRDYNRGDYYAMFSAVFQNFSLLAGTIATNVAQTSAGIDMERVKECVQKAGLDHKIETLPDGYETYLNREVYENAILLSGGETQRLMLARALYKKAVFLVLDEPTAALDPIAESDMYQKYNEMTDGMSSIYISHRLASTRFCDRILLIDNGGIVEEGTHGELLKAGCRYAGLYEVQSKYYREGDAENEEG